MFFQWKKFCDRHGIRYVSRGPNTAHNHISIHCPFCGPADTSEHLGLSLDPRRPAWGCWRSRSHRGLHPARLIQELLGCSHQHARSLVDQGSLPELDSFNQVFSKLARAEEPEDKALVGLKMPTEFRRLGEGPYSKAFEDYLTNRGFVDVLGMADSYNLRYCLTGAYKHRLILPIYYQDLLVGWTGRDITGTSTLRYLSLSDDPSVTARQGLPPAPINLKKLVLWQDYVERGGEGLVIVEGPLDSLKMDHFNSRPGVLTTCLFGKPTHPQVRTLSLAARKFKWVAVLLDPDAWADALPFVTELSDLSGKKILRPPLPSGAEDPGALTEAQVEEVIQRCLDLGN